MDGDENVHGITNEVVEHVYTSPWPLSVYSGKIYISRAKLLQKRHCKTTPLLPILTTDCDCEALKVDLTKSRMMP